VTDDKPNPLAEEIRQAARPRLNLNMPPRPDLPDEAIDTRSRKIGEKWGATTQIGSPQSEQEPTAPLISVRFDCPDYLDRAVSVDAAQQNCTKTYLILKALKQAGYEVRDVDLVIDRRKLRGKPRL
jgi:hypothetical protein